MDMIVNSLYSNRDVFLRELISNCSDALDKIRFIGVSEPSALRAGGDLEIRIKADPEAKTITIECAAVQCSLPAPATPMLCSLLLGCVDSGGAHSVSWRLCWRIAHSGHENCL